MYNYISDRFYSSDPHPQFFKAEQTGDLIFLSLDSGSSLELSPCCKPFFSWTRPSLRRSFFSRDFFFARPASGLAFPGFFRTVNVFRLKSSSFIKPGAPERGLLSSSPVLPVFPPPPPFFIGSVRKRCHIAGFSPFSSLTRGSYPFTFHTPLRAIILICPMTLPAHPLPHPTGASRRLAN